MNKQRMTKMLKEASAAVAETGLGSTSMNALSGEHVLSEGTQNLIGQLILASVIEESGSSISMSLDKLEQVTQVLGEIARSVEQL